MEFFILPHIIKPKILNKGLLKVSIIILLFLFLVLITEIDIIVILSSFTTIFIIILAVILYLNRTIIVEHSGFLYKGLFYQIECKYNKILSVDIAMQNVQGSNKYFLIIKEDKPIVISNLQLYKKDEIRYLLDLINDKRDKLNVNKVILLLDKVKWIM